MAVVVAPQTSPRPPPESTAPSPLHSVNLTQSSPAQPSPAQFGLSTGQSATNAMLVGLLNSTSKSTPTTRRGSPLRAAAAACCAFAGIASPLASPCFPSSLFLFFLQHFFFLLLALYILRSFAYPSFLDRRPFRPSQWKQDRNRVAANITWGKWVCEAARTKPDGPSTKLSRLSHIPRVHTLTYTHDGRQQSIYARTGRGARMTVYEGVKINNESNRQWAKQSPA